MHPQIIKYDINREVYYMSYIVICIMYPDTYIVARIVAIKICMQNFGSGRFPFILWIDVTHKGSIANFIKKTPT